LPAEFHLLLVLLYSLLLYSLYVFGSDGDCAKESNVIELAIYDMNFFGHYLEEAVGVATIRTGQKDLGVAWWGCGFHVLPRSKALIRDLHGSAGTTLGHSWTVPAPRVKPGSTVTLGRPV
jgi:hypothetical protein